MKVLESAAGVELVRVPRRALTTDTPFVVREQADHVVLLASSSLRLAREQFAHEVFVRQIGQEARR